MEPDGGLSEKPVGNKEVSEGWLATVMNVLSKIGYGKGSPHLVGTQRMPKIGSACLMPT